MTTKIHTENIFSMLKKYNLTNFQIDVLLATLKIPKGSVSTYRDLALAIKRTNANRAVGTALKKNPLPIIIPCHRVIKSDGTLGNYSYGGVHKKYLLLKKESTFK